MDNPANLVAVHVPNDDVDLYSVSESGWYAIDEENRVVLGPFESLGECDTAIGERVGPVLQRPLGSAGHMLDRH